MVTRPNNAQQQLLLYFSTRSADFLRVLHSEGYIQKLSGGAGDGEE